MDKWYYIVKENNVLYIDGIRKRSIPKWGKLVPNPCNGWARITKTELFIYSPKFENQIARKKL